jgi:hypothetical protein
MKSSTVRNLPLQLGFPAYLAAIVTHSCKLFIKLAPESDQQALLVISISLDKVIHLLQQGSCLGEVSSVDVLVVAVIICGQCLVIPLNFRSSFSASRIQ